MTEFSQMGNYCSTENQGFEFSLLTTDVQSCTTRDSSADDSVNPGTFSETCTVYHLNICTIHSSTSLGETAWNETRKQWLGDTQRKQLHKDPEDPVISWSTTYEELLWTGNVFDKAIPLSEMVDFLVDIWHDEGLYD